MITDETPDESSDKVGIFRHRQNWSRFEGYRVTMVRFNRFVAFAADVDGRSRCRREGQAGTRAVNNG